MDRPDESELDHGTTGAPTASNGNADGSDRAQPVAPASVTAVSGDAWPGTTAQRVTARSDADGGAIRRARGRFAARVFTSPPRRWLARRLLAAADAERERIEQDIHDGVQQQLTALRIRLALAAEGFLARGDVEAGAVLQAFGDDVDHVIDEGRDLAHGIYPALLTCYGLSAALIHAGLHAAVPVTVHANGVRRCRPDVEIAVYFACLAALDNAVKHAGSAPISLSLSDTGAALRFSVCDAGAGFDPSRTPSGRGIANMRDRIAVVGGTLSIGSAPGHGTRVEGSVPQPWPEAPRSARRPVSGAGRSE